MAAQISIPLANVAELLALGYTKIEIWHSTNQGGTYQEITASSARAAVLVSTPALNTYLLGGRTLELSIDGGPTKIIEFPVLVQYWTPERVATRINQICADLASYDATAKTVTLTSPTQGRSSRIEILYCDAHDLGFAVGTVARGLDACPTLAAETLGLVYTDAAGAPGDRYKWRFSKDGLGPVSEFAERVLGSRTFVPNIQTAMCTANFVGLDGAPQKRNVIISSRASLTQISSMGVGSEGPLLVSTDDLGYLQVPLVRGAKVCVAIEGTTFVREFTVPDVATFDLLQVMAEAPDPFTIQPTLPFLTRRSL